MSEKNKKKISIGVEDFKEIIDRNGYFVDKTLMIRDILESNSKAILLTRPRRFGKTLNQFMIRRFFEDERTERGREIDNRYLFHDLAISCCDEDILRHQQQYPVIFISLKSGKQSNYRLAYTELKKRISDEFSRHKYVLQSEILSEKELSQYKAIMNLTDDENLYLDSIGFLSQCLAKYHGRNTFILIDEYDVPLENAYFQGFYDEMLSFVRSLFESALKTNPYLEKGIITGCLRISRESIFTGLNNLDVDTVLHTRYGSCFGFTEDEVKEILDYYNISSCFEQVKTWYDGYRFGSVEIYNPWSILKYTNDHVDKVAELPLPYWSNTSSNSIIRELVEGADDETKKDLESLMDGGVIEKPIHEDITYGDIRQSKDSLWNFLFFTGYLKAVTYKIEEGQIYLTMTVPNMEVKTIYRQSILSWFDRKMENTDRSPLIKALEEGDCEAAEDFISEQLMDTISYFDHAESYYHGFMAGLLKGSGKYRVLSNRESGIGRPDIVLKTPNVRKGRVIILEFKIAASFDLMEGKCQEAAEQIKNQRYVEPFISEGYNNIDRYAICFYRKDCMVSKV